MDLPDDFEIPGPVAVTGASGFIGSWITKLLLDAGATVHGTARDPSRKDKVGHLDAIAADAPGSLQWFAADLLEPGSFDAAFAGCRIVFHSASPFFITGIRDAQTDLIDPALEGTLNVLEAVNRTESVERVVLTSSVAAMYGEAADVEKTANGRFNEEHWNDTSSLTTSPYSYSKMLAEKAAWEIANAQDRWRLVAINPSFVIGPPLSQRKDSTSGETIKNLVDGKFRMGLPALSLGLVDVRDVAAAHLMAATREDAEGRHILCNETRSMLEMGALIEASFPKKYPTPKMKVPKFVVWLGAPLLGFSRHYVTQNVGYAPVFDNTRSRERLGITYRPVQESLRDHVAKMAEFGWV